MDAVQFSGLASVISAANQMAASVAATITGNAGWFVLFATAGLLVFFLYTMIASLSRLGRGGTDTISGVSNFRLQETYMAEIERRAYKAGSSGESAIDNLPISAIDSKEHRRVKKLGLDK